MNIVCDADGFPHPEITWDATGKDNIGHSADNSLTVLNVTQAYDGIYTCIAQNINGADTLSFMVDVYG